MCCEAFEFEWWVSLIENIFSPGEEARYGINVHEEETNIIQYGFSTSIAWAVIIRSHSS